MKKFVMVLIGVGILAVTAFAGVLMKQETRGTKTICYYSDGSVATINGMDVCPATN